MAYCSRPDYCLRFFRQRPSDAAAGMLAENKPNTLLLGYPVASIDGPQNTFFAQLLTCKENPTATDIKVLDAFGAIHANALLTFLFAMVEGRLTPYGARAIVNALQQGRHRLRVAPVPVRPHSLGLSTAESANGSSQLAAQDFGRADVRGQG